MSEKTSNSHIQPSEYVKMFVRSDIGESTSVKQQTADFSRINFLPNERFKKVMKGLPNRITPASEKHLRNMNNLPQEIVRGNERFKETMGMSKIGMPTNKSLQRFLNGLPQTSALTSGQIDALFKKIPRTGVGNLGTGAIAKQISANNNWPNSLIAQSNLLKEKIFFAAKTSQQVGIISTSVSKAMERLNQANIKSLADKIYINSSISKNLFSSIERNENFARQFAKTANIGISATMKAELIASSVRFQTMVPYKINNNYESLVAGTQTGLINSKIWSDMSKVARAVTMEEVVANYTVPDFNGLDHVESSSSDNEFTDDEKWDIIDAIRNQTIPWLSKRLKSAAIGLLEMLLIYFATQTMSATPMGQSVRYWIQNDATNFVAEKFEVNRGQNVNYYRRTTVANLAVRVSPRRSNSQIKCLLGAGEVVKVVERKAHWSRVQLSGDGGFGWVMNRYLKVIRVNG